MKKHLRDMALLICAAALALCLTVREGPPRQRLTTLDNEDLYTVLLRCGFAFKHEKTQALTEELVKNGSLKLIVSKIEQSIYYDGMGSSNPARLDLEHSPWEAVVEYYGEEKLLEINAQYERWKGSAN